MSEIAKAYKVLFENGQIAKDDIPEDIQKELFPEVEIEEK